MDLKVLLSCAIFLAFIAMVSPCPTDNTADLSNCGCNTNRVRPSILPRYLQRLRLLRPTLLRQLVAPQPAPTTTTTERPPTYEEMCRYERYREKCRDRTNQCKTDNCLPMNREVVQSEQRPCQKIPEPDACSSEEQVVETPKKKRKVKKIVKTIEEIYTDEDIEIDEVVAVQKPAEKKCGCQKKEHKPKVIECVKKTCGCNTVKSNDDVPIIIGHIEYVPKTCEDIDRQVEITKKPCAKKEHKDEVTVVSKCKCGQDSTRVYVPKKNCESKKPAPVQKEIDECDLTIKIDGVEYVTKKQVAKTVDDDDDDAPIRIAGIEYVPKRTTCADPQPTKPTVGCKCFCGVEE